MSCSRPHLLTSGTKVTHIDNMPIQHIRIRRHHRKDLKLNGFDLMVVRQHAHFIHREGFDPVAVFVRRDAACFAAPIRPEPGEVIIPLGFTIRPQRE